MNYSGNPFRTLVSSTVIGCLMQRVNASSEPLSLRHLRKEGESNAQGTLLCSTAFQAAAVTYRLAFPWMPVRAAVLLILCRHTAQVHRTGTVR